MNTDRSSLGAFASRAYAEAVRDIARGDEREARRLRALAKKVESPPPGTEVYVGVPALSARPGTLSMTFVGPVEQ